MAGYSGEFIRRGIYDALDGDATLSTLGATIYQRVPEKAAFPYVAIGAATETPLNTMGCGGRELKIQLDTYSEVFDDGTASDEAFNITDRVDELLDFSSITVAGYTLLSVSLDVRNALIEPRYMHIVSRYRVLVQEV